MFRTARPFALNQFASGSNSGGQSFATSTILDANDEYVEGFGQIFWDGLPSSSKTVSAAGGGKVIWVPGTNTFSGGTNLRISIQAASTTAGSPGRGDDTDAVYADLVGGTDSLTAETVTETVMESGSISIAHGDTVAVRFKVTSVFAGNSVGIRVQVDNQLNENNGAFTHTYLAAAHATGTGVPNMMIQADDGTYGWFYGGLLVSAVTINSFHVSTAGADEYGNTFIYPFPIRVVGMSWFSRPPSGGAVTKFILYSDPLGTPVAEREVSYDMSVIQSSSSSGNGTQVLLFDQPFMVRAGVRFALAIQPQAAVNSIDLPSFTVSNSYQRKPVMRAGETINLCKRLDGSGAFTEVTTEFANMFPLIDILDTEDYIFEPRQARLHARR